MRTTIDGAGRIVVPKAIREALNLEGGTVIEIQLRSGKLEVEPVATPMKLERHGDRLVATTEEPLPKLGVEDVRAAVESQRR